MKKNPRKRRVRKNPIPRRAPLPYRAGQRVELHPGTDRWMMGDRYGEVVKVTRTRVYVKLDKSGKTIKLHPSNIGGVVNPRKRGRVAPRMSSTRRRVLRRAQRKAGGKTWLHHKSRFARKRVIRANPSPAAARALRAAQARAAHPSRTPVKDGIIKLMLNAGADLLTANAEASRIIREFKASGKKLARYHIRGGATFAIRRK